MYKISMRFFVFVPLLWLAAACHSGTTSPAVEGSAKADAGGYSLDGTITHALPGAKVYLLDYWNGTNTKIDSAVLDAGGHFTLHGRVQEPVVYLLGSGELQGTIQVPLDNSSHLRLVADAEHFYNTAHLSSSPEAEIAQQYRNWYAQYDNLRNANLQRYLASSADTAAAEAASAKKTQAIYDQIPRDTKQLIRAHADSYVAPYLVLTNFSQEKDFAFADSMTRHFEQQRPTSRYTQKLVRQLQQQRATAVGHLAPEINLPTPAGPRLALSALRGHYVLVDFWASWCGPCREANPEVLRLYHKYHARGFDVYGVSLDDSPQAWVKAIAADKLPWHHVSDLKGFGSEACQTYSVQAIPFAVLLDQQGRIVAKNLTTKELGDRLAALLPAAE
ncbi:TlpA disulfide reductase family protein [Hymenobacter sp. BT491]|uniref:TlpA disulfide reductase family protein n=1 Tax=Hymenobacter sp. BT491 TaxID=2766779 RepID=UPI001653713A|nr:TlpA disulfide reductase family protein [Hymenobacter sp. BT491]MBC6989852.1 AhpC/TSA family protein [Hymenobacter sp. BT491]